VVKYIFKRILIFIPTLVAISLLAFVISLNSPTDPVERLVNSAVNESDLNSESSATEKLRQEVRKKLGLDLPTFYFNISSAADCDTLYRISNRSHQENLSNLTSMYGNWDVIQSYYHCLKRLNNSVDTFKPDSIKALDYTKNELNEILNEFQLTSKNLFELSNPEAITSSYAKLAEIILKNKKLFNEFNYNQTAEKAYSEIKIQSQKWKTYIPYITWNGIGNQYHLWLFGNKERGRNGAIRGDFGKSYIDNKSVGAKMLEMFPSSFFLVMASIILAYIISIPLGIYSSYKKDSFFDKISSVIVFMLYSLPSFFVATWLLYKFANPDIFRWFPTNGIKDPAIFNKDWGWLNFERIQHQAKYFVLPLIAFTYSSFAFTSRIMRVSMVDVMSADYIRTARAKGLSEKKVVLKHALRNGLLPIITMFANIFPAAIGGSVILETIFGIPGLGGSIYEATLGIDIPMIVAVFTLTGVLTVIGFLFVDILYALVDPRISYAKK